MVYGIRLFDPSYFMKTNSVGFKVCKLTEDAGISGLNSKTHMKIMLKWMRGRKMLKLFCNRVGSSKKFLHCTLPEEPQIDQSKNSIELSDELGKASEGIGQLEGFDSASLKSIWWSTTAGIYGRLLNSMSSKSANEDCLGWAARDPSGVLSPYQFSRRTVGIDDVSINITHCGVCYADVAWTRNHQGHSKYPLVPGHEIVGIVREVGSSIQRFKVGGYSSYIVVHERYCFRIPENYPLALAAPLLCAGITVYSPMMRHNMNQPGKSLGVIGLGGLGHLAVKFGKAFGLNVTVFSTSVSKKEEALNLLGADKFVISSDEQQMTALAKSLDFIINTASGDIPFDQYMSLLKTAGVLALVGFPSEVKFSPASLNLGMKSISGSVTGGTKETQEMLDFCAACKIYPEIEIVPIQYANEALERLIKRDVKYRFVIDIENTLK
ncbi:hypothetical protein F0562_007852 [Nyssa sinensis]|uniref:Enoyl reductase (ER) domain-containing protein n=1 Tax=Nyssa sinensis TaxID=561372 RepID=A0A5J5A7P1_9ASTE|nr:hypothetical protein F0562_007852 [Nyssa sinensis]